MTRPFRIPVRIGNRMRPEGDRTVPAPPVRAPSQRPRHHRNLSPSVSRRSLASHIDPNPESIMAEATAGREIQAAEVLGWFHSIPNGQGASVRLEDVRHFTHMLSIFRINEPLQPPGDGQYDDVRSALEIIIDEVPGFLRNGNKAIAAAKAEGHDDQSLAGYHEMQADLLGVLEAVRKILINGRFRPRPERKQNSHGYWHSDALFIGQEVVLILNARTNRINGLGSDTAPAIAVVREALHFLHGEEFEAGTIVKAILRRKEADKKYREDVRRQADRLRADLFPNIAGDSGEQGNDDEHTLAPPDDR